MILSKVLNYVEKLQEYQMIHMMKKDSISVYLILMEVGYVNFQNEIYIN